MRLDVWTDGSYKNGKGGVGLYIENGLSTPTTVSHNVFADRAVDAEYQAMKYAMHIFLGEKKLNPSLEMYLHYDCLEAIELLTKDKLMVQGVKLVKTNSEDPKLFVADTMARHAIGLDISNKQPPAGSIERMVEKLVEGKEDIMKFANFTHYVLNNRDKGVILNGNKMHVSCEEGITVIDQYPGVLQRNTHLVANQQLDKKFWFESFTNNSFEYFLSVAHMYAAVMSAKTTKYNDGIIAFSCEKDKYIFLKYRETVPNIIGYYVSDAQLANALHITLSNVDELIYSGTGKADYAINIGDWVISFTQDWINVRRTDKLHLTCKVKCSISQLPDLIDFWTNTHMYLDHLDINPQEMKLEFLPDSSLVLSTESKSQFAVISKGSSRVVTYAANGTIVSSVDVTASVEKIEDVQESETLEDEVPPLVLQVPRDIPSDKYTQSEKEEQDGVGDEEDDEEEEEEEDVDVENDSRVLGLAKGCGLYAIE